MPKPRGYLPERFPQYQHRYGYRPRSGWDDPDGPLSSPWAEGDIVDIPADSPGFTDKRIPHTWCDHPELSERPGRYVVVTVFSIAEDDSWYLRVAPVRADGRVWTECSSDRLHMLPVTDDNRESDYTAGWTLVHSPDPTGVRAWPAKETDDG